MICMTLHHIDDHLQLLRDCYARLASGGFVAIADLEREDGSFHEDTTGIFHFGFDSEKLRADVESIGFTEVLSRQIHLLSRHDRDYPVFLLTAQKK